MREIDGWAIELKKYAENLRYNVIDISGPDLTYERMPEILATTKPAALFNFSYGRKTCLMGNPIDGMTKCTLTQGDGMPSNLSVLSGIAVVSYSSFTGGELGERMIKAGCPALVGFKDLFMFVSDGAKTLDVFKKSLLILSERVLRGFPIGEAIERASCDLSKEVVKYKDLKHVSLPLLHDMRSLTLLGDADWGLEPP
jgi:hypothetical protein